MKLEIMERRRRDPRYLLLKFVMKVLTNDGKRGLYNNKEYLEYNYRVLKPKPNGARRNYIGSIVKKLNLRELNYQEYGEIYDEMVKDHGYTGERPVFRTLKYIIPTIPLYLTEEFLKDNEKVLSNPNIIKKSRSNGDIKKR